MAGNHLGVEALFASSKLTPVTKVEIVGPGHTLCCPFVPNPKTKVPRSKRAPRELHTLY